MCVCFLFFSTYHVNSQTREEQNFKTLKGVIFLKALDIIELIYNLDRDAGIVSQDQRAALKELAELEKKSKASEAVLNKARAEMNFNETEMRRFYKKIDDLEDKKSVRAAKLNLVKTDEEHRSYKRELIILNVKCAIIKNVPMMLKTASINAKKSLDKLKTNWLQPFMHPKANKKKPVQRGTILPVVYKKLQKYVNPIFNQLDERVMQHYLRVAKITHNADGPICPSVNSACGNCRMDLPPQTLNHLALGKWLNFVHTVPIFFFTIKSINILCH